MVLRIVKREKVGKRSIANTNVLLETGRELKSQTNGNAVKQKKNSNFERWYYLRKVPCDQKTAVFGIETGFKYIIKVLKVLLGVERKKNHV